MVRALLIISGISCVIVAAAMLYADADAVVDYADAQQIATLKVRGLHESSGLAASRIASNMLWSHNDSGDRPRLYAIGTNGADLGICKVEGAKASDWEDMASFTLNGRPFLLVGDTGDNGRRRKEYKLYLIPEQPPAGKSLKVDQVVRFRYENGPCDCEALAFDPTTSKVILIDKGWDMRGRVYELDWPSNKTDELQTAKQISVLKLAGITGLDISPDGRRAMALTYGPAYEFTREEGESWKNAFSRPGRLVRMPVRRQGESICYGADGKVLYLTSEKRPTPLFCVPVQQPAEPAAEDDRIDQQASRAQD